MSASRPHMSYWIIALLGLFWNLMGCLNYITQTNAEAVAQMPEAYQALIATRPAWATAAFAVAVFGGAVGCILLVLRRRVAMQVLVLSLIAVLATLIDAFTSSGLSVPVLASTGSSLIVAAALVWMARLAEQKAWLR